MGRLVELQLHWVTRSLDPLVKQWCLLFPISYFAPSIPSQILLSGQKTRCASGQSGRSRSSSSPNSTCRASVGSQASNCALSPSLNWRPERVQSTALHSTTSCRPSNPLARVSGPGYYMCLYFTVLPAIIVLCQCKRIVATHV